MTKQKETTVYFVSGNQSKVFEIASVIEKYGVKLKQVDLDLPEVKKENDVKEIARQKALDAVKILKKPVVCEDNGLFISCLNGFPGINTKFAVQTIGVKGIINLLKQKKNRSAEFRSALAFASPNGKTKVFTNLCKGKVILKQKGNLKKHFPLDTVFVPKGDTRTFSQMTLEEKNKYAKHNVQNAIDFAEWFSKE
ncbi:non-canonical purine NTP pyrophosphatase [Nanoarchaeota archaeon]